MRRLLLLVSAVVLVDTMFYAAIAPLLPTYADELGLSKAAAGVLTASYAAGTLVGALPGGWLAGRIGGKATMVAGLALLGVTSVAFAFADTVVLLDTARFVQGVAGAATWAGGLAWLMGRAPRERRGELIGAAIGAAIFGLMLGPVIGGAATQTSPELVFCSVAGIAFALLAWAWTTPAGPREEQASWRRLWEALHARRLLVAVWLFALPALFSGVLDVLLPLRLDELGATAITIGAVFLVAAAIEGALSPVVGRISDRRGRMVPLRAGLAGAAVMAMVLPLPGSVGLLAVTALLAVAALGSFWAPAAALLSDASEDERLDQGFAFGLMNLAWAGGQVLGGAAGGGLAELTSDTVPYTVLAALCAGTLLLSRRWARARSRVPGTA